MKPTVPPSHPESAAAVRVLLVDDHRIVRDGLRLALSQHADLQVVGEAGDRKAALLQIEQLQPQVVIMDIGLPDVDGVELAQEVLNRWPQLRIIILSAVADQDHLDRAMEAGVKGYLLKASASADLVRAIRAVENDEPYLSPEVSAVLLAGYRKLREAREHGVPSGLSEREVQVLKLISEGRNTKEIAADLNLSIKTVETHRTRLMTRLGVHSVAELTKYAIRMGYTTV
ncbi:MAG TPA: response regulator transcription factor [Dongiaceae bacterium]|jgi:DNA-binding NarL/FixJ family response regulator|nr:response regulator transcription factor [Dongiaceae bacterium]